MMRKFMNKLINPFMKWLLYSPFHSIVSDNYMLISVTGRKSGNIYTTPVQYKHYKNTIFVVTSMGYKWWRNLQGGAEVSLHLHGQDYDGFARVSMDPGTVAEYYYILYPTMAAPKVEEFALKSVAVAIELQPELDPLSQGTKWTVNS